MNCLRCFKAVTGHHFQIDFGTTLRPEAQRFSIGGLIFVQKLVVINSMQMPQELKGRDGNLLNDDWWEFDSQT